MAGTKPMLSKKVKKDATERTALSSFSHRPKIFVRYVDDCFCVLKREDAPVLLQHLNSIQPTIQFTMEEEVAGRIAFLDVEVQRKNTGFVAMVYREPTHTGQYLDFASAHPVGHKRSVLSALFTRAQRLCSSTQAQRAEEKKIRQDLASNGYPTQILSAQQRRSANQLASPRKERKRAVIPYAVGVSKMLSQIFSDYDVQVCHVPTSKLAQQLVHAKEALER